MRWLRRLLGIRSPSEAIMRGPGLAVAATVIRQTVMEAMLGDIAETTAQLRAQGIQPRAVAIRSGSLHGLEVLLALPVIRLSPESPVERGVLVQCAGRPEGWTSALRNAPGDSFLRGFLGGEGVAVLRKVGHAIDDVEAQAIWPRAVALAPRVAPRLTRVLEYPVVRLHPDSPVEWGVIA